MHQSLLIKGSVFPQYPINCSTNACRKGLGIQRAREMALVEDRGDFIAFLETSYSSSYCLDTAGTIRCRNNAVTLGKRVFTLCNNQVAIIERRGVDYIYSLVAVFLSAKVIYTLH
jgi:hypothetical protein